MKTFNSFRESMGKKMPKGEHVFDSKVAGHDLMIHKEKGQFVAYIDMEKLEKIVAEELRKKDIIGD